MKINGQTIEKGKITYVNLNVAKLPTHTLIDIPVCVYRSKKDGPVLLLTAGIHGDELNGIEIIRNLIVSKSIRPSIGTVIAVPIVNVFGFLHNERYLPDGKDLNRCFPGKPNGSLASRIAYTLMKEVLPIVDLGVDFHTGGASRSNFPQIRCEFSKRKSLELAKAFSPPMILNSKQLMGSFRREAYKKGKHILVFEGGESLRFDDYSIGQGIRGVKKLMSHLGMKKYKVSKKRKKPVILPSSTWIRARISGLFRSYIEYGDFVKKGQVIASLTDPFGEAEVEVKVKNDGYIIGVNKHPVVNKGDAIVNLGAE
ncbi:MAG: DUF2817 domain-containing protein [Candidatus Dadabacteria bacterium]|nr:DUF2817 domain-containing protein [Candidatus Dadabacteria bacterium]NIQ16698.1 DUF2817 domain-containing protein [Candidatus Dadabacteria bacterium]